MSPYLCRSSCCNNVVRLADLRGKPIEFRRFKQDPPVIGTRWNCPGCGVAYFACWRDATWSYTSQELLQGFVIDLAYYHSFSALLKQPDCLCLDNAEDAQSVW